MKSNQDVQSAPNSASTCGAEHGNCPNTWKGTCGLPAGHDGSHYCDSCSSYF